MTAFDEAWALVKAPMYHGTTQDAWEQMNVLDLLHKAFENVDPDWFMEQHGDIQGLELLGQIMAQGGFEHEGTYYPSDADETQQIILEQLLHPSNQFELPTAKTPTLYRAHPIEDKWWEKHREDEWGGKPADQFRAGRFFTPQLLTAEQYSGYQGKNMGQSNSPIYEFEMPVPLDHESVLHIPRFVVGRNIKGGIFNEESPEVERMAEGNNMTMEDALEALERWNGVYGGFVPSTHQSFLERVQPYRNAGWDHIVWPETASQATFPPTVSSAYGAIDWGAGHEAHWFDKIPGDYQEKRQAARDWWRPAAQLIEGQMGIPRGSGNVAMGKHEFLPQWGIWNIGEEDTAPQYRRKISSGINDWKRRYRKGDYDNFRVAAGIAARGLGG